MTHNSCNCRGLYTSAESAVIHPSQTLRFRLKEGWIPAVPSVGRDDIWECLCSMPIHPAYAQVSALLGAVFILIAGNGLSNTLIPLSATAASFPQLSIGVIASCYFGGMLICR